MTTESCTSFGEPYSNSLTAASDSSPFDEAFFDPCDTLETIEHVAGGHEVCAGLNRWLKGFTVKCTVCEEALRSDQLVTYNYLLKLKWLEGRATYAVRYSIFVTGMFQAPIGSFK